MPKGSADRNRSRGALIVLCFLALPLFSQDAASVALLVSEPNLDGLGAALKSPDALTRAAAARVALVRNVDTLLPQLRESLAAEKDAAAAREAMRALVILGTDEDVAFAASHRSRFPASIDGDFAEAIGRIGAPRAVSLYLQHVAGSRDPAPAIDLTLWGRTSMASGTASRFMGAGDARGFGALMRNAAKAKLILEPGIVIAALGSNVPAIAADAVWYLVETYAADPTKLPEALREPATAIREGALPSEAFGREIVRRMLGAKFVEQKEHLAWLRESPRVPYSPDVERFLTLGELAALDRQRAPKGESSVRVTPVRKPEFLLPIALPEGLAEAILKKTKCSDAWIGVVKASVDRAGRVQSLSLDGVGARGGCMKSLEAMLRLSLADPVTITSPLETTNLLVVKPRGRSVCFDDDPITDTVSPRDLRRVGQEVTAPKIVHREEPVFPEQTRKAMDAGNAVIIAESIITRRGCVRDVYLVQQSPFAELNTAAVFALSQWRFKPGTLNGQPVDVIFNLSINFKTF